MIWWILFSMGWILFALWLREGIEFVRFVRGQPLTDKIKSVDRVSHWPLVSVVVPARDEGEKIEACLRSLLNLDYPSFEVIAVDDRSRDGTGAIMDRIAEEDERLRVIHVKELPAGWIGKNHAMWKASQEASGDFLLFTDGDVIFETEALTKAILYMTGEKLDHLCLMPQLIPGDYWENAQSTFFGFMFVLALKPGKVSSPSSKYYCGIGAFNLVKRAAYASVGGHEAIRLEIIDDFELGRVLKRSGFRQDMQSGTDLFKVKWQEGLSGVIKGMEKNTFAFFDYSLKNMVLMNIFSLWACIVPYLGLIFFRDARIFGYLITVLTMHALYGFVGSRFKYGWRVTPTLPVVWMLHWWAVWRSAVITLRQGGVRWRDTFYPLDMLKRKEPGSDEISKK